MYSLPNWSDIDAMRRSTRVMALGAVMETLVGRDTQGRWPCRVVMASKRPKTPLLPDPMTLHDCVTLAYREVARDAWPL